MASAKQLIIHLILTLKTLCSSKKKQQKKKNREKWYSFLDKDNAPLWGDPLRFRCNLIQKWPKSNSVTW